LHIQKTTGEPSGKTAHEKVSKNIHGKNSIPTQAPAQVYSAKIQPIQPQSSAANSAASTISFLISHAKLPADKLSASIILFARFFSLPMKPEVLTAIRRQAFMPQNAAAAQTETIKSITQSELLKQGTTGDADSSALTAKNRLIFSLAAAAAESKGVELEAKGLELYANAIDPDMERRRDSSSHDRRREKKQDEQNNEGENLKSGSINGNTLKKIALESAEKNSLLYLLNRLPGNDGQRWIVLPFDINENGRDYRVSLRILPEMLNRVSLMTMDIVEIGNSEKRSTFTLEAVDGSITMLNIYMQPELSAKAKRQLERSFSGLLNIPVERVSFRKSNDSFPQESGSEDKLFCPVDEAM
jgi:hypothetical protein